MLTRVAEIKALQQLPNVAKDAIFPLICASPWPNAKSLDKTWAKISESFQGRRFGLDLEVGRRGQLTSSAGFEFDQLFSPLDGHAAYYEAVGQVEFAVPVVQIPDGDVSQAERQMEHIRQLERGSIIWFRHAEQPDFLGVLAAYRDLISENCLVVIDAGWAREDILLRVPWASAIIQAVLSIDDEVELVVGCSSFPNSFTGIGTRGIEPIHERTVFDQLVRRHNQARLVYGDWASTRPRAEPIPMKNIPRIDLPMSREWTIFRADRDLPEGYKEVAQRALSDASWPAGLQVWGTYMVESTASDLPIRIKSPATATAVRINLHLFRQAFYNSAAIPAGDADEPYVD